MKDKIVIFVNRVYVSTEEFHNVRSSLSTFTERTFRKAPQKAPSAVSIYGVDPSTVRVVWRYVAPSLEEEPLIGYKVNIMKCSFKVSLGDKIVSIQGQQDDMQTLRSL